LTNWQKKPVDEKFGIVGGGIGAVMGIVYGSTHGENLTEQKVRAVIGMFVVGFTGMLFGLAVKRLLKK
jgi:uncharacterized protein YcfJ